MTAVLQITDLSIALPANSDRAHAVEKFSVTINTGETMCVVGESGSGKTMTAHAVMGLLPDKVKVAGGSIRLSGTEVPVTDTAAMQRIRGRDIGMIFQEPMTSLNPVMKIGDQMEEVFMAHGQKSKVTRSRIEALLEEMGLPDPRLIAKAFPHQLSGGQRQRVMIAMALALSPKLLIADEPTTALDVTTQAQILKLIDRLRRDHGTSVMLITHDFGVVREIADKVVVLQQGIAVEQGPADVVLNQPTHDYTKALIASVPSLIPPVPRPLGDARTVLKASNLKKTFGRKGMFGSGRLVKAVNDVSLEIRCGETLGIVGESGSGKSTTARCIVRLIEPESGKVSINGTSFLDLRSAELRQARSKIQMVFQDPYASLNPRRKVGRIIAEGPETHGLSREVAMKEARELLKLVGLPEQAADRYPHEFSGGQRQRIGIARAIALKPALLIADEAVSALDVSVQSRVLKLLADLQKRLGLAMLFVTHDLRVAAQICDRIAVMQRGEVVELQPAAELFGAPQHSYTRQLFASVPGGDTALRSSATNATASKTRPKVEPTNV
ncbi:ABC transporter ATP-binding protein [Pseudooceanicola sp.]|uniref:ABC transporter ATP-binding protein n=1 Tax=Pseudooceanicola sp. TaxID=1914328 RepID=UPI003516B984